MNRPSGLTKLKYRSENILERRRRILREARTIIAEVGYANFNIRDLCERAGIAQKTLYNAFGSKENVIALAIRDFVEEFREHTEYVNDPATMAGRLEMLLRQQAQNMHVRHYTAAILAVFNSSAAGKFARVAVRELFASRMAEYVDSLVKQDALAKGVTPEWFGHLVTTTIMAVTTDWSFGEILEREFLDRQAEAFVMVVEGMTTGDPNLEARKWLVAIRENQPKWQAIRKLARSTGRRRSRG